MANDRDQTGKFVKGHAYRFKPGLSGNPGGRPKSVTLSEAYRKAIAKPVPNDPEGRTFAELIAETVAKDAVAGNVAAARELADRVEGRARQSIDLSVDDERRRAFDRAVQRLVEEAKQLGETLTHDEAARRLAELRPELMTFIN